ncbi:unnamed protein product, partial [Mesorhabditis belari]|uniref:Calcineurin-like phosphoesterase domain-containing protein n=1 Tax=Mesorhabditis belari TaxID=2138241 RepID=A0AAF3JCB2_9BILA
MNQITEDFRKLRLRPTKERKGQQEELIELNSQNAVNSRGTEGKWLKFVVISDTHEKLVKILDKIPRGDVLIHCGDFTNYGGSAAVSKFNELLGKLPHQHKIVIPGNHEYGFDTRESAREYVTRVTTKNPRELLTNCTLLMDESIEISGIKLLWQLLAHSARISFYCEPGAEIREKWAKIPNDVDVLITHEPPRGFLDKARNPKFHVFGHIHECYGAMTNGKTTFINAAQLDRSMQTEYAFYLSPDERKPKWAQIPADVDILITHGPPLGYLDARAKDQHYGDDEQLLEAVEQRDPKFHVFGHIHECYGAMTNGRTIFVNAAQLDRSIGCKRDQIPDGDVLVHCGDFTNFGEYDKISEFND